MQNSKPHLLRQTNSKRAIAAGVNFGDYTPKTVKTGRKLEFLCECAQQ